MKRNFLRFCYSARTGRIRKIITIFTLCFAMVICLVSEGDAHTHSGHHNDPLWHYYRLPDHGVYVHRLPHASCRIYYGE